jgi:hypothetical protein
MCARTAMHPHMCTCVRAAANAENKGGEMGYGTTTHLILAPPRARFDMLRCTVSAATTTTPFHLQRLLSTLRHYRVALLGVLRVHRPVVSCARIVQATRHLLKPLVQRQIADRTLRRGRAGIVVGWVNGHVMKNKLARRNRDVQDLGGQRCPGAKRGIGLKFGVDLGACEQRTYVCGWVVGLLSLST